MCEGSDVLVQEVEQGLRAVNLPFLIVYGPRFSGKSLLLEQTPLLCRQFALNRRLLCLNLDFRADWNNPGDPVRQVKEKLIEVTCRALPEYREYAPAGRNADLPGLIASIGEVAIANNYWGILLLWDHFDHLPNEGMRCICRQMKILKENRTAKAICKRIGIVAASARNLSWLNDSKDSPFLGYEPILLLAAEYGLADSNEPHIEEWLAREQPLVRVIQELNAAKRISDRCSIGCLSRKVVLAPVGAALFGQSFLHLVSSVGVREMTEQLLSRAAITGSRSAMPDYDEFEETGLFVAGKSSKRYRFRNNLFARLSQDCLEALKGDSRTTPPVGSLARLVHGFDGYLHRLSLSTSLTEAIEGLRLIWLLAIDEDPPDYYLCFECRGKEVGWIGCRRDEVLRFWASSDVPSSCKKVRELSSRRKETFVYADDERQSIWHRQKTGDVALVHLLTVPRRRGGIALNESNALHVRQVIVKHQEMLAKFAALEYGKYCLSAATRYEEDSKKMAANTKKPSQADTRLVFIVHGRNLEAKRQMEDLLLRLELKPIEWEVARSATGKAMPSTLEIIQAGLKIAQAVVVLMTGDDRAKLSEEFDDPRDSFENELKPQPRQNVLIEAGMATALYPDRTLLVEFGPLRPISDFAGLNTVRYDGSAAKKMALAKRLKDAGCPVNFDGTSWIA